MAIYGGKRARPQTQNWAHDLVMRARTLGNQGHLSRAQNERARSKCAQKLADSDMTWRKRLSPVCLNVLSLKECKHGTFPAGCQFKKKKFLAVKFPIVQGYFRVKFPTVQGYFRGLPYFSLRDLLTTHFKRIIRSLKLRTADFWLFPSRQTRPSFWANSKQM